MATITPASTPGDVGEARALFLEYGASLGFSLCFQGFDAELTELPGAYDPPLGRLLLARVEGAVAGCVALRPIGDDICEMKRLFVRPSSARGWDGSSRLPSSGRGGSPAMSRCGSTRCRR